MTKIWLFKRVDCKHAQNNLEQLLQKIYEWRRRYTVGKELYKFLNQNFQHFEDLEKGAAFFIYNRITFSGTALSGGFSEHAFVSRFNENSIRRLTPFSQVIQNVTLTNDDYKSVVKKNGTNVLLFLDPPYYSATKSALYGKRGHLHKTFNHVEFAEVMKNCQHKWLITYDDSKYIHDLFSFANIVPWKLKYGMRNVSKDSTQIGNEIVISNY